MLLKTQKDIDFLASYLKQKVSDIQYLYVYPSGISDGIHVIVASDFFIDKSPLDTQMNILEDLHTNNFDVWRKIRLNLFLPVKEFEDTHDGMLENFDLSKNLMV